MLLAAKKKGNHENAKERKAEKRQTQKDRLTIRFLSFTLGFSLFRVFVIRICVSGLRMQYTRIGQAAVLIST
jgi:hypothetical protein